MDPITLLAILSGAGIGGSLIKGGLELWLQHTMGKKQLTLQKAMTEGETARSKTENDENRRQSEQFMTMFQSEKAEGRKERAKDRQVQLLGAMLAAQNQMRQGAVETQATLQRPLPPTSMTSLMRGW